MACDTYRANLLGGYVHIVLRSRGRDLHPDLASRMEEFLEQVVVLPLGNVVVATISDITYEGLLE